MPLTNLTNAQLQQLLADEQDLQVVDVRTEEEWHHLGHIPQAMLMPIHELLERWGELDKTRKTVLICEHGIRSADASHYLHHRLGFEHIYNLTHGMADWDGERRIPAQDSIVAPGSNPDNVCVTTLPDTDPIEG